MMVQGWASTYVGWACSSSLDGSLTLEATIPTYASTSTPRTPTLKREHVPDTVVGSRSAAGRSCGNQQQMRCELSGHWKLEENPRTVPAPAVPWQWTSALAHFLEIQPNAPSHIGSSWKYKQLLRMARVCGNQRIGCCQDPSPLRPLLCTAWVHFWTIPLKSVFIWVLLQLVCGKDRVAFIQVAEVSAERPGFWDGQTEATILIKPKHGCACTFNFISHLIVEFNYVSKSSIVSL